MSSFFFKCTLPILFLAFLSGCGPEKSTADVTRDANENKQTEFKAQISPIIGFYEGVLKNSPLGDATAQLSIICKTNLQWDQSNSQYLRWYSLIASLAFHRTVPPGEPIVYTKTIPFASVNWVADQNLIEMTDGSAATQGGGATGGTPPMGPVPGAPGIPGNSTGGFTQTFTGHITGVDLVGHLYTSIINGDGQPLIGDFTGKKTQTFTCD